MGLEQRFEGRQEKDFNRAQQQGMGLERMASGYKKRLDRILAIDAGEKVRKIVSSEADSILASSGEAQYGRLLDLAAMLEDYKDLWTEVPENEEKEKAAFVLALVKNQKGLH